MCAVLGSCDVIWHAVFGRERGDRSDNLEVAFWRSWRWRGQLAFRNLFNTLSQSLVLHSILTVVSYLISFINWGISTIKQLVAQGGGEMIFVVLIKKHGDAGWLVSLHVCSCMNAGLYELHPMSAMTGSCIGKGSDTPEIDLHWCKCCLALAYSKATTSTHLEVTLE